jgi:hypothetical protein
LYFGDRVAVLNVSFFRTEGVFLVGYNGRGQVPLGKIKRHAP